MTDKELDDIEECGKCHFKAEEIAILLEMDVGFIRKELEDENSPVFKRFNKGRYMVERNVRQSIISMAEQGSTQAQTLFLKLRDELKSSEA